MSKRLSTILSERISGEIQLEYTLQYRDAKSCGSIKAFTSIASKTTLKDRSHVVYRDRWMVDIIRNSKVHIHLIELHTDSTFTFEWAAHVCPTRLTFVLPLVFYSEMDSSWNAILAMPAQLVLVAATHVVGNPQDSYGSLSDSGGTTNKKSLHLASSEHSRGIPDTFVMPESANDNPVCTVELRMGNAISLDELEELLIPRLRRVGSLYRCAAVPFIWRHGNRNELKQAELLAQVRILLLEIISSQITIAQLYVQMSKHQVNYVQVSAYHTVHGAILNVPLLPNPLAYHFGRSMCIAHLYARFLHHDALGLDSDSMSLTFTLPEVDYEKAIIHKMVEMLAAQATSLHLAHLMSDKLVSTYRQLSF